MKRTIKKSRYVLVQPKVKYDDRFRLRKMIEVNDLLFSLLAHGSLESDRWKDHERDLQKLSNGLKKRVVIDYYPEGKELIQLTFTPEEEIVETTTEINDAKDIIEDIYRMIILRTDRHIQHGDFNIIAEGDNIDIFRVEDGVRRNIKTIYGYKSIDRRSLLMDILPTYIFNAGGL